MIKGCDLGDRRDRTEYGEEGDSRLDLVVLCLGTKLS